MGHLGHHSYTRLARRLEQYVPGVYFSETLFEILKHLVTEEEARLCALLPLKIVPLEQIADIWKKPPEETRMILGELAHKGMVMAFRMDDELIYILAPPVLGFFEFSLMRSDGKLDARELSRLYYQYCNIEGDFVRQQGSASPALSRTFVHEDLLTEVTSEVLTHDRISAGIDSAAYITTGQCYCRHKMEHMGQACTAPIDVCLTFNDVARHLAEHGIARPIDKEEAHRIVRTCMDNGLVQIGDNTRSGLAVICNCCGCCCDLLLGYKRFRSTGLVSPSAFIAAVRTELCTGCGICASRCQVDSIKMIGDLSVVDGATCLGCGVCARFCPVDACHLIARSKRPFVPEDVLEKIGLAAIDAAKLGNYLFDDQVSRTHAVLRSLTNFALKFSPVRRFLRSEPVWRRIRGAARRSRSFRNV